MPLGTARHGDTLPTYAGLDQRSPFRGRKAVRRPLFGSKRSPSNSWLQRNALFLFLSVIFVSLCILGLVSLFTSPATHHPSSSAPNKFAPISLRRSLLTEVSYATDFTLTFFTAPREFSGIVGEKQRSALVSWLALVPQPQVVLLGADPELGEVAEEYAPMVTWDNRTDTNFLGLPLYHSMLLRARAATSDVAVLIEPDTILLPDFSVALAKTRAVSGQDWLLLGRRREVQNFPFRVEEVVPEDPSEAESETGGAKMEQEAQKKKFQWVDPGIFDSEVEHIWALELMDGSAGEEDRYKMGLRGMKEFVHERGALHRCHEVAVWAWDTGETPLHSGIMPPFLYTRGSYDEWLLHEAVSDGQRQVIDASHAISAVRVLGSVANLQPFLGHTRVHSQNGEYRDTRTPVQRAGGHFGAYSRTGAEHKLWKTGPKGVGWEVALNRHLAESYGTFGSGNSHGEAPWRMGPCRGLEGDLCFFQREEGIHSWAVPFEVEECEHDTALQNERPAPHLRVPVGMPMTLAELLPLVASPGGTVTLVVVANNYREMLLSFVCRLRSLGVRNLIVGAVDSEIYRYASEQGLPVFQDLFDGNIAPDECHFGTQCFRDVTKLKSRTVVKVLRLGYNVLMSDVDVIWFRDPTPIMLAYGPNTFTGQSDQHNDSGPANDERRFNSGFYLARAEATTIEALTAIADHAATTQLSEQPSFHHVLCQAEGSRKVGDDECEFKNGLRVVFLNRTLFPNGATSYIWEKQHTKEFCEERGCVILHNNWVKGRPYKFWREKYKGFWRYNAHYRMCQYDWMNSTNLGVY